MKNDVPSSFKPPSSRLPRFLREFIHMESSSGIIMIAFATLALIAANSPLSSWYYNFFERARYVRIRRFNSDGAAQRMGQRYPDGFFLPRRWP